MSRKEWLLLALAAGEGKPLSPAQLQKSLFVLSRESPAAVKGDFYKFIPYHYGPFDPSIYSDADTLAGQGLVAVLPTSDARSRVYGLTEAGAVAAAKLDKAQPGIEYLRRVVKWAQACSFQALISTIYAKYPEYKVNSAFRA